MNKYFLFGLLFGTSMLSNPVFCEQPDKLPSAPPPIFVIPQAPPPILTSPEPAPPIFEIPFTKCLISNYDDIRSYCAESSPDVIGELGSSDINNQDAIAVARVICPPPTCDLSEEGTCVPTKVCEDSLKATGCTDIYYSDPGFVPNSVGCFECNSATGEVKQVKCS